MPVFHTGYVSVQLDASLNTMQTSEIYTQGGNGL